VHLERIENAPGAIKAYAQQINRLGGDFPGFAALEPEDISNLDTAAAQALVLENNLWNPVISDSVERHRTADASYRTVEEVYQELLERAGGWRRLLPQRRDPAHNAQLDHFVPLIMETQDLRRRGVYVPDNFVTMTLETPALVGIPCAALIYLATLVWPETFSPTTDAIVEALKQPETYRAIAPQAGIISACGGLFASATRFPNAGKEQSVYIDNTIDRAMEHGYLLRPKPF